MFKTAKRIINFKTLFIIFIYIFIKSDKKNITTYEIKEESMATSLLEGDYVIAIKNSNEINRGDILIFNNLEKNIDVVKRVIGLPRESIKSENGVVSINNDSTLDVWGKSLTDNFTSQTLGDNEVFVLGDQRKISTSDSRTLGPISLENCWKVKYRYWPIYRIKSYE